jgi:hypothetical protein
MKHVRIVTKNQPIAAFWWNWFGQFGELKQAQPVSAANPLGLSFKGLFVNALWNTVGSLDPRDV